MNQDEVIPWSSIERLYKNISCRDCGSVSIILLEVERVVVESEELDKHCVKFQPVYITI